MKSTLQAFLKFFTFGRGVLIYALILILSYGMHKSSSKDKLMIADFAVSTFLYPAQYVTHTVLHWQQLHKTNAQLKQENARLRLSYDLLTQELAKEQRIDLLRKFETEYADTVVISEIIAKNPGRLHTSVLIDRGMSSEVEPTMPVFTSKGLVGKISKVYLRHSVVQLLYDPQFKVSVIVLPSRIIGVMESPDSKRLLVEVPVHSEIAVGDSIITSGLGGIFPKGVAVGVVKKITDSDIGVLKTLEVTPFQKHYEMEELLILRKSGDWVVQEFAF